MTDDVPAGQRRRALWLAPSLVFALALLVTAMLLLSVTRSIDASDRAAFEAEATRTVDAVRERADTIVTLLHGAAGLFAASEEVRREQFADYIEQLRLRERYPGIQGIGFAARAAPSQVRALAQRVRNQGDPTFRVWPPDARDDYTAIVLLEPLDERNRAAVGYDMATEPTRRAAMQRARDSGEAVASGKVQLVQEIDASKQNGFLIYLPVYLGPRVPATVEARREQLQGYVYAPLRVGDLLAGVRGRGVRQIDYELYDGHQAVPHALMRSTRAADAGAPRHMLEQRIEVAGRPWLLRVSSRPEFERLSQRGVVPWLAALSLLASLLLARITWVQARARRDAEAAAAQRQRDAAALRASEEQARERAATLEVLSAQLREGDRRKDEFIAVLAHELRNPLAPIRNALEILQRVPEGPQAQRARDIAGRQLQHMVRLIDDLLDVSRISRGKIVLQRQAVRVADVVQAAVETSRPLMDARRHALVVQPVPPQLWIEADPTRVAQVLTNLLNNAGHYTPEGGRVEVQVVADGGWVRIAVCDNGIGIEPQRLPQVFELFVQVDRSGTGGGLGIGLSLSARLAALHGGRVEAHSEGLGRGSRFVLVLPLAQPPGASGGTAG